MAETARLHMSAAESAIHLHKLYKSIFIDRWLAVFYCFLCKYATQRTWVVLEPAVRKKLHFHLS